MPGMFRPWGSDPQDPHKFQVGIATHLQFFEVWKQEVPGRLVARLAVLLSSGFDRDALPQLKRWKTVEENL